MVILYVWQNVTSNSQLHLQILPLLQHQWASYLKDLTRNTIPNIALQRSTQRVSVDSEMQRDATSFRFWLLWGLKLHPEQIVVSIEGIHSWVPFASSKAHIKKIRQSPYSWSPFVSDVHHICIVHKFSYHIAATKCNKYNTVNLCKIRNIMKYIIIKDNKSPNQQFQTKSRGVTVWRWQFWIVSLPPLEEQQPSKSSSISTLFKLSLLVRWSNSQIGTLALWLRHNPMIPMVWKITKIAARMLLDNEFLWHFSLWPSLARCQKFWLWTKWHMREKLLCAVYASVCGKTNVTLQGWLHIANASAALELWHELSSILTSADACMHIAQHRVVRCKTSTRLSESTIRSPWLRPILCLARPLDWTTRSKK